MCIGQVVLLIPAPWGHHISRKKERERERERERARERERERKGEIDMYIGINNCTDIHK